MTFGWRTKVGSWKWTHFVVIDNFVFFISFPLFFLVAFSPISLHSLKESGWIVVVAEEWSEWNHSHSREFSRLLFLSTFSAGFIIYIDFRGADGSTKKKSLSLQTLSLVSFFVAFFVVYFFLLHVFMERALFCLYLSFLCWKSSLKFENSLFANETNEFRSCCTPNKRCILREPQKRENYIRLSSANPPQQQRTYDENWKFSMPKIPEIQECLKWI